jgi:hypothetical protein
VAYAKVFTITSPGSTGQVTYGGPSATVDIGIEDSDLPMLIGLYCVNRSGSGGGSAHARIAYGLATDRGGTISQVYVSFASEDAIGTADGYWGSGTADILKNTDGTTSTVDYEVSAVSFQTGSFTLDWQNLPASSMDVYGFVLTDSLVADALVGDVSSPASTGVVDETLPSGFGHPDLILTVLSWNGVDPPASSLAGDSWMGFGVRSSSANGRGIRFGSNDGATTQATTQAIFNNRALHLGNNGGSTWSWQVNPESGWPTDGFETNWLNASGSGFPSYYAAIKLATDCVVTHGGTSMPSTVSDVTFTGTADLVPVFTQAFFTRQLIDNINTVDSSSTTCMMAGFGIADGDEVQRSMGWSDDDAQGTSSVCGTYQDAANFIEGWNSSNNTQDSEATITVAANGEDFTVSFSDASSGLDEQMQWYVISAPAASGDQNVNPTGIASAEAFGTPTFTFGNVDVTPTGIASAEAFGTVRVDQEVTLTGIASAEAFGTPTLTPGNVNVSLTGIASAEAFGTPTVQTEAGDQNVNLTAIASAEAFGTPTFAFGNVDVTLTGISSAEAFGAVALDQSFSLTGITSAEAFGTVRLDQMVALTGIASAEAFGGPIIDQTILLSGIPSAMAFGTVTIEGGVEPGNEPTRLPMTGVGQ